MVAKLRVSATVDVKEDLAERASGLNGGVSPGESFNGGESFKSSFKSRRHYGPEHQREQEQQL